MSIAIPTTRAYQDSKASLSVIESAVEISRLLGEAQRRGLPLLGALNRQADREVAKVVAVTSDSLVLEVRNFQERSRRRHRLSLELDGKLLSFETNFVHERRDGTRTFSLPRVVFVAERREVERAVVRRDDGSRPRVALHLGEARVVEGEILDEGACGLGIALRGGLAADQRGWLRIRFLDGESAGREIFGEIRHAAEREHPNGWVRVGLRLSEVSGSNPLDVERLGPRSTREVADALETRVRFASALARQSVRSIAARVAGKPVPAPTVPIVDFRNEQGERIRAIIDHVGDPHGAPAVIMPPAWGKTKETLSPLAETILETFRRAGKSIVVVRYDGIRRKGESFTEPDCLAPGREFVRFTVSQALRDIRSTLTFLHTSAEFRCRTSILVTFSASAIEGRRAVAMEGEGRIGGWISVVGAPDLQYAMRVLSGGVDYYGGLRRGFRFGQQEVLGTVMDIDLAGLDALENGIASLEDARRDMAQIRVPITWIHGRYDGWMSLERVRDVLGCGETEGRRLIEIPTGHQLKTSREALKTFSLIASEVGRMALGRSIRGVLPDLVRLERRRTAERERLPRAGVNLRTLWRDYLVGRDGQLGIELMTASAIYGELMKKQVEGLRLFPGCTVADLGSGTGALATFVATREEVHEGVRIHQVDLIREGLLRARDRLREAEAITARVRTGAVVADLNIHDRRMHIPLRSGSCDRVLAGLVISYLDQPAAFLIEAGRLLRRGGRLVVSSLRRDADISRIYRDGIAEMSPDKVASLFGSTVAEGLEERFRRFLSEGARILDLEERGYFRFWDEDELASLVREAGFSAVETDRAFGDPPQAIVVSASKR